MGPRGVSTNTWLLFIIQRGLSSAQTVLWHLGQSIILPNIQPTATSTDLSSARKLAALKILGPSAISIGTWLLFILQRRLTNARPATVSEYLVASQNWKSISAQQDMERRSLCAILPTALLHLPPQANCQDTRRLCTWRKNLSNAWSSNTVLPAHEVSSPRHLWYSLDIHN